jgi:hypothetical protein
MYTKPNQIILPISLLLDYIQMYQDKGDALNWIRILELEKRPPVSLIQIHDDGNKTSVLASSMRGWKEKEIKIGKIEVVESWRKKDIGNILMKMLFVIAEFYGASRITGAINGKKFLRDWYKNLGFTISDDNKLIMELDGAQ